MLSVRCFICTVYVTIHYTEVKILNLDDYLMSVIYDLAKSDNPSDVYSAWESLGNESQNFKAIIALNNYDKNLFPGNLKNLVSSNDTDFVSYFQSEKLYFIDDELIKEMIVKKPKNVNFPVDYSITFDTNYASYIHHFVENTNSPNMNNSVFLTIHTLLQGNFHFDYVFYLIENYKNVVLNDGGDFCSNNKNHLHLYRNLVNLELFKSIDNKKYSTTNEIVYQISEYEAFQNVDSLIYYYYKSTEGKEMLDYFVLAHKQMVLFLIGVLKIHFGSNVNAKKKLIKLFSFMNEVVGVYLDREMIVAYKYFKKSTDLKIFNKIHKGGDQSKLFKKIENIAWDFIAPRVMENFISVSGEGRYFIPFFLSHDHGIRELLRLYSVKGVIIDNRNLKPISFTEITNVDYWESEKCNIDFDYFFSSECKRDRKSRFKNNIKTRYSIIEEEFKQLVDVMER